jgi:hypothetical protein
MKKLFKFFLSLLTVASILVACTLIVDADTVISTPIPSSIWSYVVGILLSIYEIVVRIIPTVANISVIHWIITILKWLDVHLNNQKTS